MVDSPLTTHLKYAFAILAIVAVAGSQLLAAPPKPKANRGDPARLLRAERCRHFDIAHPPARQRSFAAHRLAIPQPRRTGASGFDFALAVAPYIYSDEVPARLSSGRSSTADRAIVL
jgi:hypothetical protein